MCGGGMDLTPHLANAFIKLDSCIPTNIAINLSLSYNAYINKDVHAENCKKVAGGMLNEAMRCLDRLKGLGIENKTVERHLKGLSKINL